METDNKFFYVNNQKYTYLDKDPIFDLEGPVNKKYDFSSGNGKCNVCSDTFKDSKEIQYCTFCGNGCCKTCRNKERPFPKKNLGHSARGEICLVCDRKFFVREMIKTSTVDIENN